MTTTSSGPRFSPGVIVLEKRPRWEAVCKRHFGHSTVVQPCRLSAQILEMLQSMPGSVVVIDFETGSAASLRVIKQAAEWVPRPSIVGIAPASLQELEWPARELGADGFLIEPFSPRGLIQFCERHLEATPRGMS